MGTEKVKEYLANFGLADRVMEFKESSATVAEAAADLGCEPARIGKTMAFDVAGQPMLVVIAGDGKVDNAKYKAKFHCKACMIKPDELVVKVGHPMGGVCPFAVCPGVPVYLDETLPQALPLPRCAWRCRSWNMQPKTFPVGWILPRAGRSKSSAS